MLESVAANDEIASRLRRLGVSWRLTARQTEVLGLVARGLSNKEVACRLGCSIRTVELHLTHIFARSDCDRRTVLLARFWWPT